MTNWQTNYFYKYVFQISSFTMVKAQKNLGATREKCSNVAESVKQQVRSFLFFTHYEVHQPFNRS